MGTWGITAFEDDTALEHYDSFCREGLTISDIRDMAITVLNKNYDLELDGTLMDGFDEPTMLLVMAEILAKSNGLGIEQFPNDEYHTDMEIPRLNLKKISSRLTREVIQKLADAIKRIQADENIHYYTLWKESDNFEQWTDYSNGLIERLEKINFGDQVQPSWLTKILRPFKR